MGNITPMSTFTGQFLLDQSCRRATFTEIGMPVAQPAGRGMRLAIIFPTNF
jgi:hypothetical protein